ncbi:ACH2-like protein [Mya arenaria]|uniref:ACH2-like protein n=1 Tax=Mya arenaria TaxID=6604 RepID=A0ABY7FFD8_MYAAR|nr:acetylcholine receptor subunit beta-type lev-1-like [Mya arenaria]WAR20908.1 ACH2-like protein [Mya arenaria]
MTEKSDTRGIMMLLKLEHLLILFLRFLLIHGQYGDTAATVDWATQRSIYKGIYSHYYNNGTPLADIVPVSDLANGALQVNMSMTLASLNGFDAVSGQIDISGSMLLEWEDEVVASTLVGSLLNTTPGVSADVLVDYDKAWAPNIVLVNAVDTVKDIGDTSYKLRYSLAYPNTATVNWEPRILLRASCTPDVTFYPFDRQVCDFTYTAWGYLSGEITLSVTSSEWDTTAAEANGVWKIISTESQTFTTDGSDYVRFRLTIQREPLYFTFNIALPILLLGLLNGFVFLLPAESGERIGFCITCFLSFVVLMQTTMGFLPEIASPMSLLCIYVFLMMCFSVFINITCILMSRIYQKPAKEKVPNWMKTVVRVVGCQVCRCLQKPPRDPYPEVEWPDVARMLDFFFFLSFLGSQASLTFFFLLPLATRY